MSGMDIAKEAGQSLTGVISKAIIEISDERKIADKINVSILESGNAKIRAKGLSGDALKNAVKELNGNIVATMDKLTKAPPLKIAEKKRFEVKFNPNQISFQVYAGNKVAKTNLAKSENDKSGNLKIEYQDMAPRIQMNVQLIFDDYERTQAFMLEKATDPSAILRTGVVAAVSAAKKKTYSVRPQVEGFIAALRNPYTRKITFNWGSMSYGGVLTSVSAEYTMFSTDGNPIRANVNLGLLCTDETISDKYMGQWQNSFKEVFEDRDMTELGSKLQNVGNLLNINL